MYTAIRPLWSHNLLGVRPQGSIDFRTTFPLVFGSTSLDQGLAEWHPVGCFIGTSLRRSLLIDTPLKTIRQELSNA